MQKIGCGGFYIPDGCFTTKNGKKYLDIEQLLANFGGITIMAESNTVLGGYQVPKLTVEDVTKAYNAVVAGRSCTITDANDTSHFVVNQADIVGNNLTIEFLYYNVFLLTYTINDHNQVEISYYELRGN